METIIGSCKICCKTKVSISSLTFIVVVRFDHLEVRNDNKLYVTTINGKYQSEVLRFKTPNIVIVFSNDFNNNDDYIYVAVLRLFKL